MRSLRFVFVACLVASLARADLRVVGTDLLGLEFSRALYAFSGSSGIKLALAFEGSRSGLEALKGARADLALIVPRADETTAFKGFETRLIGYHAVLVLAPVGCPLEEITFGRLALVFGETESGVGSVRWSDLGVTGDWSAAAIAALVPEAGSGLTAEYFRSTVLRGRPWRAQVQRYATVAELPGYFGDDSRALALASTISDAGKWKVLPVAASPVGPAVAPSSESIHEGRYPLRLPIVAVFRADRQAALGRLWEFIFDDDAARLMERAGVSPLPPGPRAQQLQALRGSEKSKK